MLDYSKFYHNSIITHQYSEMNPEEYKKMYAFIKFVNKHLDLALLEGLAIRLKNLGGMDAMDGKPVLSEAGLIYEHIVSIVNMDGEDYEELEKRVWKFIPDFTY